MDEIMRIIQRMTSDIIELTFVIEELTKTCQKLDERVNALEHKQQRDDDDEPTEMS